MIEGAHFLLFSRDADADRRFLRDVIGLTGVDAGGGWLILGLPPAEIAVHPATQSFVQRDGGHEMLGAVVYLMCDDVHATIKQLAGRGATTSDGRVTLEAVYCLGLCATAPSAMLDGRVVGRLDTGRLDQLLKEAQL